MHEILEAVRRDGRSLEQMTLDDIARAAGISRATLLRRVGSRGALERAALAAGLPVAPVASVRERAAAAAAELIEAGGLATLTIEAVAERAGCSVPAVYRVFENRDGLLLEVFERYTPLGRVAAALTPSPPRLAEAIRALYRAFVDAWGERPALLRALVADLTGNPAGPVRRIFLRRAPARVLPLVLGIWARAVAAGECRPLPPPLFAQLVMAPLVAHLATRDLIGRLVPLPGWEETIELLAEAACRAVAPPAPVDAEPGAGQPGAGPSPLPPIDPEAFVAGVERLVEQFVGSADAGAAPDRAGTGAANALGDTSAPAAGRRREGGAP